MYLVVHAHQRSVTCWQSLLETGHFQRIPIAMNKSETYSELERYRFSKLLVWLQALFRPCTKAVRYCWKLLFHGSKSDTGATVPHCLIRHLLFLVGEGLKARMVIWNLLHDGNEFPGDKFLLGSSSVLASLSQGKNSWASQFPDLMNIEQLAVAGSFFQFSLSSGES